MDVASWLKKIGSLLKRYKYAFLVLFIGLGLMLLPEWGDDVKEDIVQEPAVQVESVDDRLADILSKIEGAGDVQVLLTLRAGEEILYQTNNTTSTSGDTNSAQVTTVTITTSEKDQTGLIRQINPPTYMGAIIVCQGADQPGIRLAVVEAVSKVTGLGADRISVLKMK